METLLRHLSLEQKIEKKKRNQITEGRILNIVYKLQDFVDEDDILGYLKSDSYNLNF